MPVEFMTSQTLAAKRQLTNTLPPDTAYQANGRSVRGLVSEHPAGTAAVLSYLSLSAQRGDRCRPFLADAAGESVTRLYDQLGWLAGGAGALSVW